MATAGVEGKVAGGHRGRTSVLLCAKLDEDEDDSLCEHASGVVCGAAVFAMAL